MDFSQLNPHLLYIANYKELGSEDAYDRVLDGEHRDIVKQAFNAMVQASSVLTRCPDGIDIAEADIGWVDLRDGCAISRSRFILQRNRQQAAAPRQLYR